MAEERVTLAQAIIGIIEKTVQAEKDGVPVDMGKLISGIYSTCKQVDEAEKKAASQDKAPRKRRAVKK